MSTTAKSPHKLIERPRLAKIRPRDEYWLVLDPHRTGLAGGAFFAWLAILTYAVIGLIRWESVFGPNQLVSVTLCFVVGYAGVALFVIYLLRVGEREFPLPELPDKRKKKKTEEEAALEAILPDGQSILDSLQPGSMDAVTMPEAAVAPAEPEEIPSNDE